MDKSAQTPNLLDVVSNYHHLRVEDYQRTYAWKNEQIEEFLADVKECTTTKESHFFGTLILQDSGDRTATVVDGQQRLTTAYILIAALRDQIRTFSTPTIPAKNENQRDVNVLHKTLDFLCYSKNLDDYRFESSRFLRKMLKAVVLAEPKNQKPVPSRDNTGKKVTLDFRKAIVIIRNWVSKDLEDYPNEMDKLERVDSIIETVLNRFIVLKVTTGDINESLDIFLTLNNRGLPLGPSDLVRGEVMRILSGGLPEDGQLKLHHSILEDWTNIVDLVGDPETFLRHYLVSTTETKVQKKRIVREVTSRIFDEDGAEKKHKAQTFWKSLQEAAVVYGGIVKPQLGGDAQYRMELLEGLGKSHRVILLAVLSHDLEESQRDEIIRLVFVLAFRNVMAGMNAQKLEDFYQQESMNLRGSGDFEALKKSLLARCLSTEINPQKYLVTEGDSGFIGRALLHYVNRATSRGANHAPVGSSDSHLEHIAPQSEIEHWAKALYGSADIADGDYESDISSIGNLTLLDKGLNIQAQRKPFSDKKDHYKLSNFEITRDLCELPDWNIQNIGMRATWLIEMFEIIWSVNPTKNSVKSFTSWLS